VEGVVRDKITGDPILSANVYLSGQSYHVSVTDSLGKFHLQYIGHGNDCTCKTKKKVVFEKENYRDSIFESGGKYVMTPLAKSPANGHPYRQISNDDIKGIWYLNKWTSYRILVFDANTVFVDNHVDTVFTLRYDISHDTLFTWTGYATEKYKNRIISISKDSLVLDGMHASAGIHRYSRSREKTNIE
jgi:hypothetical protein